VTTFQSAVDWRSVVRIQGLGRAGDPDIVAMVTAEVTRTFPGASFDAASGQFLVPVPGGRVRITADNSPYVTTTLLSLERFAPDPARVGAPIIAPTYSAVGTHERSQTAAPWTSSRPWRPWPQTCPSNQPHRARSDDHLAAGGRTPITVL
jgi:hypothetical protein